MPSLRTGLLDRQVLRRVEGRRVIDVQATQSLVLENVDALENGEEAPQEEATVEDEVEEVVASELLELTSVHSLHDMDNEKNDDGLDDMDDLDENLEEEEDEEVDYSKMSKVELKEQCSAMGLETKGKKKHELLALLTA